MKEWLSVNWRVLARVAAVIVLYVLAKWAPLAIPERESIEAIFEITGLVAVGLLPGLRVAKRAGDE